MQAKHLNLPLEATYYATLVAFVLALIKLVVTYLTSSLSMQLNFIDSCFDFFVSLANYFATKLSVRTFKEYSFGYDKITAIAALIQIFLLLLFTSFTIREAINKIINPSNTQIQINLISICSLIFSTYLTFLLLQFQEHVIKKTGHLVVYADRLHYTTDILTNIALILCFLVSLIFPIDSDLLDALLSIFLSGYILFCCIVVIQKVWLTIMDGRLSEQREEEIATHIKQIDPNIFNACVTHSRFSGVRERFDVLLSFKDDLNLSQVCEIKKKILKEFSSNVCVTLVIEFNASYKKNEEILI